MDDKTLERIFLAHNPGNHNPNVIVVPFVFAKNAYEIGMWDQIKDMVYVSFPLKAVSIPSPRKGVSKNGLKHKRGGSMRGQASGL